MPEKISDANESETQLGVRSGTYGSGDGVRFRKRGRSRTGNAREVLCLGSVAEQDAEARLIGHGA